MRQHTAGRARVAGAGFGVVGAERETTRANARSGDGLLANELFRVLLLSLVAALVAGGAAYFLSSIQPPRYLAEGTLVFSTSPAAGMSTSVGEIQLSPVSVETYRSLLVSRGFARQTLTGLGVDPVNDEQLEEFEDALSVTAEEAGSSALLHIRFTDENMQRAGSAVQALIDTLQAWERERLDGIVGGAVRELDVQIASLEGTAALLLEVGMGARAAVAQAEADQLAVESASLEGLKGNVRNRFSAVAPVELHTEPVSPQPLRNGLVAAVLAAVACYAIWLIREANGPAQEHGVGSGKFA